jgi:hypothetical protein
MLFVPPEYRKNGNVNALFSGCFILSPSASLVYYNGSLFYSSSLTPIIPIFFQHTGKKEAEECKTTPAGVRTIALYPVWYS